VSLALMLLGWAITGHLAKSAFWFALALIGQAVSLQLIDAGPLIHYQHYRPLGQLVRDYSLPLILLVVQAVLVVVGLGRRRSSIGAWLGRAFKVWQLVSVGLVLVVSSAALSRQVAAYVAELVIATFVSVVNLGNIVLAVWAVPGQVLMVWSKRLTTLLEGPRPGEVLSSNRPDRLALLAAVWVTVLAAFLSFFVYERHPHIPDEVIYLYQARYMANGQLKVSAPPVPEAFSIYMIPYKAAQWYSPFPPGWPALLALGMQLGAYWLVNPLLAGLNVLLTFGLIEELYDRRAARIAVLLLCISPWHIFMAMNLMSHTFILTCALAATVAIVQARRTGKALGSLGAGIAAGMACLVRPLDGLTVAGLIGLWAIGIGGRRLKLS
jgi:hypothetical protein